MTIPQIQPIVGAVLLGLEHLAGGSRLSLELEQLHPHRFRRADGNHRGPANLNQCRAGYPKIVLQSFFMLTTVQPCPAARSRACSEPEV